MIVLNSRCAAAVAVVLLSFGLMPSPVVGSWFSNSPTSGIQRVNDLQQRQFKASQKAWNDSPSSSGTTTTTTTTISRQHRKKTVLPAWKNPPSPSESSTSAASGKDFEKKLLASLKNLSPPSSSSSSSNDDDKKKQDFEKAVISKVPPLESSRPAPSTSTENNANVVNVERIYDQAAPRPPLLKKGNDFATKPKNNNNNDVSDENDRNLQEASCPWTNAMPLNYDPTQRVLSVIDNTDGAPATLPDTIDGCSQDVSSPTRWYTFEVPAADLAMTPATISFTTCSSVTSFDTRINVFQENGGNSLDCTTLATCIASNDDHDTNFELCSLDSLSSLATIEPATSSGSSSEPIRYYVAVSGYGQFQSGVFELQIITINDVLETLSPTIGGGGTGEGFCPFNIGIPVDLDPNGTPSIIFGATVGSSGFVPNIEGCSLDLGAPAVWYRIEIEVESKLTLSTCSDDTDFDTVLNLFQEVSFTDCTAICIGRNDDHDTGQSLDICSDGINVHSLLRFSSVPPGTYYVVVSGYGQDGIVCEGLFELEMIAIPENSSGNTPSPSGGLSPTAPTPTNPSPPTSMPVTDDDCPLTNAIPVDYILDSVVVIPGSTTGGPANLPGPSEVCENAASPAAWYEIVLTGNNSTIVATTCFDSTFFDTTISIFQQVDADSCSYECLGRNNDHGLPTTDLCSVTGHSFFAVTDLRAGTYYIAVSGSDSSQFGAFGLIVGVFDESGSASGPTPSPSAGGAPTTPIDCPLTTAIPITLNVDNPVVVTGTTVGAPANLPNVPSCSTATGSPTVWYQFTTDVEATIFMSLCGSEFDTVLTLFRTAPGDDCSNAFCLGANDNHGTTLPQCPDPVHSLLGVVSDPPADTFYIAISGAGQFDSGNYRLEIVVEPTISTPTPAPFGTALPTIIPDPNCPLTNAIPIDLSGGGASITGTTFGAVSNLPDVPNCSNNAGSPTVWYQFTTALNATIFLSTCGSSFDTVMTIFGSEPGDGCDGAFCLGFNDDHGTTLPQCAGSSVHSYLGIEVVPPAFTYYIAISGFSEFDSGPFVLDVTIELASTPPPTPTAPTPAPVMGSSLPPSDGNCAYQSASVINYDPAGVVVMGSTLDEPSTLPNIGECSTNLGAPTVWYTFQTTVSASIIITTCSQSTDFDTILNVYQELSEAACSLTCLDVSDDHGTDLDICASSTRHSILGFQNLPPGTYYVAVSGYAQPGVGVCEGAFELEFLTVGGETDPPAPPVLPPTKAPIVVPPLGPTRTPTAPTVAPVDKPRPSPAPDVPLELQETVLSIEYEPVQGPFGGPFGVTVVETATATFFSEMLFGGVQAEDSDKSVEVEMLKSDVIELDGDRSKLLVDLSVTATYGGEEEFKDALSRLVDDNQSQHISILQQTEAQVSQALGNENLGYFSAVETIMVANEGGTDDLPTTLAPNPAPSPDGEPAVQIDSGANHFGLYMTSGLIIAGLAFFGVALLEGL